MWNIIYNYNDFGQIYKACENLAFDNFYRFDGYLFKEKRLCVSNCSMHELLICEAHMSGLMRHFRVAKTLDVLHEHFFFALDEKEYVKNLWYIHNM